MFLPYETTVSLWFSSSAIYRWEPVQPVVEAVQDPLAQVPPIEGADGEAPASCTPVGLPAMRLVFKGLKWTAHPVYGMRENLAWNEASATLRQVDEQRRDENRNEARKASDRPRPVKP